ncbi:hypothetical protein evm_011340 [Chilo suppressalis]|nr:hypothetical protein evm_011340 [Chilo suppressalis]
MLREGRPSHRQSSSIHSAQAVDDASFSQCAKLTGSSTRDDIFLIGPDYIECKNMIHFTVNLLQSLGFKLNLEKSSLLPKKRCKFLGFIFNSEKMILTLPDTKKEKLRKSIDALLNLYKCKLREFAKFIGLLISCCPAIQYSWLYTKEFEYFKYSCLLNNPSYEQVVTIPKTLHDDLHWWLENIDTGHSHLKLNIYSLEIFSDASSTGWGAFCNGHSCYGHWKDEERSLHINELELRAAFLAIKCFTRQRSDCEILLRIDNVTAISCINRMGSVQYRHLNQVTRDIWKWCEKRKIIIFASYINTKQNLEADLLSRKKFQNTEWELSNYAFQEITLQLGIPEIDLFASRCNAKCFTFVTWKADPDAWAVDAFTISWHDKFFYAFPPFSLITKVMQKVINDKAEGIVVVPYWPTQAWFPLFQKLVISNIIYFEPNINLLKSPFRISHSLHKSLKLAAAKLSAHSTRHAATSTASRIGVSVDVIRKTAGWCQSSSVFAKFYNREIVPSSDQFARSILSNFDSQ